MLYSPEDFTQLAGSVDGVLQQCGLSRCDIRTGSDAWTVYHRSGMYSYLLDRYGSGEAVPYHDTHTKTALKKLFPNAVFRT